MTDEEIQTLNYRVEAAEKRAVTVANELHSLAAQTGNISTEIEHAGHADIAARLNAVARQANKAAL